MLPSNPSGFGPYPAPGVGQHHLALLCSPRCTGVEPFGKRLGNLSQQVLRCRLGFLRRDCRGMPQSLDVPDTDRRSRFAFGKSEPTNGHRSMVKAAGISRDPISFGVLDGLASGLPGSWTSMVRRVGPGAQLRGEV
jgi:hypothetical protein